LEQVEESGSRRPLSRSAAPPLEGPHPGIRWDWRTGDTVKGHQTKVEGICDPKMAMPSSHPPSSLLNGLFDLVGWGPLGRGSVSFSAFSLFDHFSNAGRVGRQFVSWCLSDGGSGKCFLAA